jgi:hypothetical protein
MLLELTLLQLAAAGPFKEEKRSSFNRLVLKIGRHYRHEKSARKEESNNNERLPKRFFSSQGKASEQNA